MKTSLNLLRCALSLLLLAACGSASAVTYNPPQVMSYQGYLTDESGTPLGSTNTGPKNYSVVFRIWNQQTGGTVGGPNELYAEQQTVTVANGYFSVLLGLGAQVGTEPHASQISTVFPTTLTTPLFVEITVLGIGASTGNITILPRLQLVSSPYSFLAANAVNAANLVNAGNTNVLSINNNSLSIPNVGSSLTVNGSVSALSETVGGNLNASGTIYANNLYATNSVSAATSVSTPTVTATNITATTSVSAPTATVTTLNATTVAATTVSGYGTIPIGGIIMWSGATAPTGWCLCDGTTSNGHTTPDLRGRFVLSSGSGNGLTSRTVSSTGGEEAHTLTVNEMPSHNHSMTVGTVGYTASWNGSSEATKAPGQGQNNGNQGISTDYTGGGAAHNTMPPFYVLAFIMRVN